MNIILVRLIKFNGGTVKTNSVKLILGTARARSKPDGIRRTNKDVQRAQTISVFRGRAPAHLCADFARHFGWRSGKQAVDTSNARLAREKHLTNLVEEKRNALKTMVEANGRVVVMDTPTFTGKTTVLTEFIAEVVERESTEKAKPSRIAYVTHNNENLVEMVQQLSELRSSKIVPLVLTSKAMYERLDDSDMVPKQFEEWSSR